MTNTKRISRLERELETDITVINLLDRKMPDYELLSARINRLQVKYRELTGRYYQIKSFVEVER